MAKPLVKKRVSVAIATYNGEKYVAAQLQSIVNQSRVPDEIIVSDDGSSDQTLSIVRLALSGGKIPYEILTNKHCQGFGPNFSTALEASTGDIVFLSDQDDYWFPNKIEDVMFCFSERKCELIAHDSFVTWGSIEDKSLLVSEEFEVRGLKREDNSFGCMMAVTKPLLKLVLPITDTSVGHDFLLQYFAKARGTNYYLTTPLMVYRRHENNVSKSAPLGDYEKPTFAERLFDVFNYLWLERRLSLLSAVHRRLSGDVNESKCSIPERAREQFEIDYATVCLRNATVFESSLVGAIYQFRSYRKLGLRHLIWCKDVVANGFKLHGRSNK